MSQECKIVDEDEISNFRRFKPEDLEKKYSPFERVQKKEFPFLFQKTKVKETKISLDDIIAKFKDLSCNSPIFKPINSPFPHLLPLTPAFRPSTPPYPYSIDDAIAEIPEIPEFNLDDNLSFISTCLHPITDLNTYKEVLQDDR